MPVLSDHRTAARSRARAATGDPSRPVIRALAVVLAALSSPAVARAPARTAVVLQPAPDRLSAEALAALCAALPVPCTPRDTAVHVARGAAGAPLWLIDASRPMLVRLDAARPHRADGAASWDFADHPHTTPAQRDGGDPAPHRLYPALYPLGPSGFAVALVSERREMYSGGGASFDTADFVTLGPLSAGGAASGGAVAHGAVPFACSTLIRACFTEREYARSPHCHDEANGSLAIRHGDGSAPWRFTWHETTWPAHAARRGVYRTRTAFTVPPGNTRRPAAVPFCGGGVDGE